MSGSRLRLRAMPFDLVLDIASPATDESFQLAIVRLNSRRLALQVFYLLTSVLIMAQSLSTHFLVSEIRVEDAEARACDWNWNHACLRSSPLVDWA